MSASRRLTRNRIAADLAATSSILNRLDPDDYFGRIGLESRQKELQQELDNPPDLGTDTGASAALFFGGGPVIGSMGIESGFAGLAINKFQDLVAKLVVEESGGLGQRGPLPSRHHSTLHITQVLKGSFGFLLEELQSTGSLIDTPLKLAVTKATHILETFCDENEEAFEQTLDGTDPRSLATARDFFGLLATNHATLRLVTDGGELDLGSQTIERAADRALSSSVEEDEEPFEGILAGLLPEAHMFELHLPDERGVVTGRVSKSISSSTLADLLASHLNDSVSGRLKIRRILRKGILARQTYTLTELSQSHRQPLPSP